MMTAQVCLSLLFLLALLFYHSPQVVLRIGCWLVSWATVRQEMKRRHEELYARMLEERGI